MTLLYPQSGRRGNIEPMDNSPTQSSFSYIDSMWMSSNASRLVHNLFPTLSEVEKGRGYLASVVSLYAFDAFAETPKTTGRI